MVLGGGLGLGIVKEPQVTLLSTLGTTDLKKVNRHLTRSLEGPISIKRETTSYSNSREPIRSALLIC